MFTKYDIYPEMNCFFLIVLLCTCSSEASINKIVYHKWIQLINFPIITAGASNIPPVRYLNYITWVIVGIFFNFYVYRKFKGWWTRNTYILSAGLDVGVTFMGLVLYFTLQSYDPKWWDISQIKKDMLNLWHIRMGHSSNQVLQHISHFVKWNFDRANDCDVCHKEKQCRNSFPLSINKAEASFELIHYGL